MRELRLISLFGTAALLLGVATPAIAEPVAAEEQVAQDSDFDLEHFQEEHPPLSQEDIDRLQSGSYTTVVPTAPQENHAGAGEVSLQSIFYCPSGGDSQVTQATYQRVTKAGLPGGTTTLRCGSLTPNAWGFVHIDRDHWVEWDVVQSAYDWDVNMDKIVGQTLLDSTGGATYQSGNDTYHLVSRAEVLDYRDQVVGSYFAHVIQAADSGNIITAYPGFITWD